MTLAQLLILARAPKPGGTSFKRVSMAEWAESQRG